MSQAGIINIAGGGGGGAPIETITGNTGGAVPPTANNINILGDTGLTVTGNPGTSTLTISLTGGGIAIDQINVDASTAPGTDPVVPTATGEITVTGAQVVSSTIGANVIRTNSLAANSLTIEVQQSGSAAAQNTALNGIAHFDSDIFTVSNGFVSTTAGSLVQTITGGPGVTITGTAANPIVNSVIFTDTTAATLVEDNGYFATAAGTYLLPATAAQGELVHIVAVAASGVIVDAPSTHLIRVGNQVTSAGGTMTSTAVGDSLTLRYRTADTTWYCTASMGNWTPT